MLRFIKSLSRDERGVSALEYAILATAAMGSTTSSAMSTSRDEGVA